MRHEMSELPPWSPDREDAWWWAGMPLLSISLVAGLYLFSPRFVHATLAPEGYGILELMHFAMPLLAVWLAVSIWRSPVVRADEMLTSSIVGLVIVSAIIAATEHSWGAFLFTQQKASAGAETRLAASVVWPSHLVVSASGLLVGLIGGALCLAQGREEARSAPRDWKVVLWPPRSLLPTLAVVVVLAATAVVSMLGRVSIDADTTSEILETYVYLLLIFYLFVVLRRVRHLEAAGA